MRKLFLGVIIFAVFVTAFIYHTFFKKEEILEPEFVLTYAENQSSDYPTTRAAYRFAENMFLTEHARVPEIQAKN